MVLLYYIIWLFNINKLSKTIITREECMARIILTELDAIDKKLCGRIIVDVASEFSESSRLNQVFVKEPSGKIHYVSETLEQIAELIFKAEAAERNCDINYQKQNETFEKTIKIQEEMLEIMKWFVKKLD